MANTGDQWKENLITKDEDIVQLARSAKRVAVLGIKTEKKVRTSLKSELVFLSALRCLYVNTR
jgi:hypothetical protein